MGTRLIESAKQGSHGLVETCKASTGPVRICTRLSEYVMAVSW